MELKAIVERQIAADSRRGFPVSFGTDAERCTQMTKDLVGLMGEVGEFANLLKKVGLGLDRPSYPGPSLDEASGELREELADAVIYIIRLSAIIGGDLEEDILAKMARNDVRYRQLEIE